MALIVCAECGKEVSDRAASCPHCGCPLKEDENIKYDVVLVYSGNNKIATIKCIKDITNYDLKESKELADNLPSVVVKGVTKNVAELYKDKFSEAGAGVNVVESGSVIIEMKETKDTKSAMSKLEENNVSTKPMPKINVSTTNNKKSNSGTVIGIVVVIVCLIWLLGSCGGGGSSDKRCSSCGKKFTNSDDTWSITMTSMCENCYDNYKWGQNVKSEIDKYYERYGK